MTDTIKALLNRLNKDFGEGTVGLASEVDYTRIQRLSSGSLFLDWALGANEKSEAGWAMGKIVELYGYESSGKSLICMQTIIQAQKRKELCVYIDIENTFDRAFAAKLGIDCENLVICPANKMTAENVIDFAADILRNSPEVKVIVFDSVAALVPKAELESKADESKGMAAVARVLSPGLRKLIALNRNNALLMFINQIRLNPGAGMYANPEYQPGGQALKFYSATRLEIRRGDYLFDETAKGEEKKKKIGQVVKFKVIKNKTGIAHKTGYFKFLYETASLDKIDELVSLAILNDVIGRSGAYYTFGKDHTFQGREKMEEALRTDQALYNELKDLVFVAPIPNQGAKL